jgi:predicted acyltransferase
VGVLVVVPVLGRAPGTAEPSSTPGASWAAWLDRSLGLSFSAEAPHSYLPSAVTVFTGVLAGRVLQRHEGAAADRRLAAAALLLLVAGLLVAPVVPVNKRLWTASYVLVTGGIGLLVLAAAHWLVDVRGVRRPFHQLEVLGTNPIVAFTVSELLFGAFLNGWARPAVVAAIGRLVGDPVAAWAYALASLAVVWSVCAALARRGMVVRL